MYNPAPNIPAPYPLPGFFLANNIANLGKEEGWIEAYIRETYRRWFEKSEPAGEEPSISGSLTEIGQDIDWLMSLAASEEILSMLDKETIEAKALGVFGSPSFVISGEVFWGDDRLEDAVNWALRGSFSSHIVTR